MYAANFAQVGANIKERLDDVGITQQKLADELGISKQVMNKIIKGSKAINVAELSLIAKVLDTTTDELLSPNGEPTNCASLSFMRDVQDEETMKKVNLICSAIDEIHMLEDLFDE